MPIKIAITEDSIQLAHVLKQKLEFNKDFSVEFIAENGQVLLENLINNSSIDIIIMDLNMPIMNGIEATKVVKEKFPSIKVVVLTIFDNDDHIFEAIMAGANGYLLKDESAEHIHQLINDVISGGSVMSPTIAFKTLELLKIKSKDSNKQKNTSFSLSGREVEVLENLSLGYSYKIAADKLNISAGTVRKHVENIYKKLQVNNKVAAIKVAQDNQII